MIYPELENIVLPDNSTLAISDYSCNYFNAPWHYHSQYEITLIVSGKGIRFVGDRAERFNSGDLVLLPPDIPHQWKSDDDYLTSRAVIVQFNIEDFGDRIWELPEFNQVKQLFAKAELVLHFDLSEDLNEKIIELPKLRMGERIISFFHLLNVLACHPAKQLLSGSYLESSLIAKNKRIKKVFSIVQKQFKSELSAKTVANEVGFTRESFSRFFKEQVGITFSKYLNSYRVEYACNLLKSTEMKIVEIAFESGYKNLSNFNRQFLKISGIPPKEYRHKSKNAKSILLL